MWEKSKRLRELLDERDIPHDDNDVNHGVHITQWNNGGKRMTRYEEWRGGTTRLDAPCVPPERAIAVTIGSGFCELVNAADDLGEGTQATMCYECGYTALDEWWEEFDYCPKCGRRILLVGVSK